MEEFVTFELAKKLKEKGFDIPCMDAINKFGCSYRNGWCEYLDDRDDEFITLKDLNENDYLLPTISQVLKWLRETHNIHINIGFFRHNGNTELYWVFSIENIKEDVEYDWLYSTSHDSYEEAALAGIEWVLDNILI